MTEYSSDVAAAVLARLTERGWSLYDSRDVETVGADASIRRGPTQAPEMNVRYALLPKVHDPRDPSQVDDALERLAQRLDRNMPTILLGHERHPLTGLTLRGDAVYVHTPEGTSVSYASFLEAIDSMVEIV